MEVCPLNTYHLLCMLIFCIYLGESRVTHVSVPLSHPITESILTLPDDGHTTFNFKSQQGELSQDHFNLTRDGKLYTVKRFTKPTQHTLVISSKNLIDNLNLENQISISVYDDQRPDSKGIYLRRRKRSVEISISKEVEETASEISLDYGNNGVIMSINNRYYMREVGDIAVPLRADLSSGRLYLKDRDTTPLDYETAPNKQYKFIIFINNTVSLDEYIVDVTIRLRDVNDERPKFTMQPFPYLATINPDLPSNSPVSYDISVADADTNPALSFAITQGGDYFRIDQNGRIYSRVTLTRGRNYIIKVQVEDDNAVANKPQIDNAEIEIRADRRPPQFYQSVYEVSIAENVPPSDLDVVIKAMSFQGDAIAFTLQDSNEFELHAISGRPNEAKIQTTTSLDYETDLNQYTLKLTATERGTGLSSTSQLIVSLIDVNDNSPRFDISEYIDSRMWPETQPIGTDITTVRATDLDPLDSENGRITYRVESDLSDQILPFTVETRLVSNGYDGVIKTSGRLDYEAVDGTGYRFKVIATDSGSPARSSSAYVRVQVQNTNDESPKFQSISIERIEATKTKGSVVTTVLAIDPDGDGVTYQIVGGQGLPFSINSQTGLISLTEDLTSALYRDTSSFTLNVSATDDGTCCTSASTRQNTGYTQVIIEIVGRNNPPAFTDCDGYSRIAAAPEETRNARVVQVQASDPDKGLNGDLTYSIVNDINGEFVIDSKTGEIRTNVATIDRETTNQKTIVVKAEDGALSKLSALCTFTMSVQDINDNSPKMDLPEAVDVQLNSPVGTEIHNLYAVDPDLGQNGTVGITYGVSGNNNFEIKGNTLVNRVVLSTSLDPVQSMDITATDGGGRKQSVRFVVNIKQTAKPPVWIQFPPADFSILENLTDDTIIYRLKAETADGGPVNYFVVPTTTLDAFYQKSDDDCVVKNELCLAIYKSQKLDADELRYYFLRVRVTPQDRGSNEVSEQTVQITLLDVNDNIPVFENIDDNGYINGLVTENRTVKGETVAILKANDSDITDAFKTKRYTLLDGLDAQYFRVEPTTGQVIVDMDFIFDRENRSKYFIKVKAADGSPSARPGANGEPNTQVADVQINVADINDNPPYFPKRQYNGTVKETAAQGTKVLTVKAEDKDIENNFQYSIISGNTGPAFDITDTGDIIVFSTEKLDYETKAVYNMEIQVSDGSDAQARTNVHIRLEDVNDHVPKFNKDVYIVNNTIMEEDESISTSNPVFLVQVGATDADVDRPTNIEYDLSGSFIDYFQIEPKTGRVYLVKSLDRDSQPRWDVNVLANDEPGTPTNRIGYAIISVFPEDINDNFPVFDLKSLTGSVDENMAEGRLVMTVRASDSDRGSNGSVKFRFNENTIQPTSYPDTQYYPYFEISPTGSIKTRAVFDRETIDQYTVEIVAYDEGIPSKSSTATATIKITDRNDNRPVFQPKVYTRSVSELTGPFSFILKVEAEDKDINDILAYSLDSQAVKNFSIDSSGNIYLRDRPLDFEYFFEQGLTPEISFYVTVQDGGTPLASHSDTANVVITVVDENDETPVFDPNTVTVDISENATVDSYITRMTATDRDAVSQPENSKIEYLIERAIGSDVDRYFKVDNVTGVITTQRLLDREVIPSHTLVVLGIDKGLTYRRTGSAIVIVNLVDINDNGPKLVDPVVYISENMPIGTRAIPNEIKAMDEDDNQIGHGPPFRMLPANGSENSVQFNFVFHPDWDTPPGLEVANGAGELITKAVLDREQPEQGPDVSFYLQLFDKQNVSAVRRLSVIIADEDDNPPSPGTRESLIYNYKGEYSVVEIGDCYAEDPDDWDKPYKTYSKSGTWPSGFDIDETTGMITANLTAVPSGAYEFRCKVTDNYIYDTSCAYECNLNGGSNQQISVCKENCRRTAEVISTVKPTIKTIDENAVTNGVSIRLKGRAIEFMQPGDDGRSPYDKFKSRLATILNTDEANVDVFTVLDSTSPGYIDVRFTAHGSPYYNATKLIGAIVSDEQFGSDVGLPVSQVPVNECLKEVCQGGCTNVLKLSDEPTLINANGSSIVGVTAVVKAQCGCSAEDRSSLQQCNSNSCLNGGICKYNKDSQTTSCECPSGFDGPRCQQLRHSFSGNGWAQYKTLSQCGNGSTSIEILTKQLNAIVLYNGPSREPGTGPDAVTDYLAIGISNGQPVAYINFGTGYTRLSVNKIVNDGFWHKLELSSIGRVITLTVDDCVDVVASEPDTSNTYSRAGCQSSGETPGENKYLNVGTMLELGGRADGSSWWPEEVDIRQPYDGCVRNLKHNGEVYDLHIGNVGRHSNSQDGCPQEDAICSDVNGNPLCGKNGICESRLDGGHTCDCKPGWRGDVCDSETPYVYYKENSYMEWQYRSTCQGSECVTEEYTTTIQLRFRSRDADDSGLLFYVKGNDGAEYIKLQIIGGKIELRYDIGSDSLDIGVREQLLTLPVIVTDGALHTVLVKRFGKRFTLQLDGGEGMFFADYEAPYSHQLFSADGQIYSGIDASFIADNDVTSSVDLENACITDIRYNGRILPINENEAEVNSYIELVNKKNIDDGCVSTGCVDVQCPSIQECYDTWNDYECLCPNGYNTLYTAPYCQDINECFPDSPCINGLCNNTQGAFLCTCDIDKQTGKLWEGPLCNLRQERSTLMVAESGYIAIVLAILLALLIALGIYCFMVRKRSIHKSNSLYDPYDDIRETIYNYDEEGMPEEDQDGYDISRLSKPIQPFSTQLSTDKPVTSPGPFDQPDVEDFINGRLNDANGDPSHSAGDELKDFDYEGAGSNAGSLSSLNTTSSGGDQDFDYLNDWGPKFSRLADMYAGGDES